MTRLVALGELYGREDLLRQLSYPAGDLRHALEAAGALDSLGVEAIALDERGGLKLLGKGFRNIVLEGWMSGARVALKIRRSDYAVRDAEREAAMLGAANSLGVGPRLIGWRGSVIVMELVSGRDLSSWLTGRGFRPDEAWDTLLSLLTQCRALDRGGLDHGELSDARRHVIKAGQGPVIIDFGSARFSTRPKNLTSIISYLWAPRMASVREYIGLRTPGREMLRRYKETLGEGEFRTLLAGMGVL